MPDTNSGNKKENWNENNKKKNARKVKYNLDWHLLIFIQLYLHLFHVDIFVRPLSTLLCFFIHIMKDDFMLSNDEFAC
jgi:hypothetical protein